MADRLGKGPFPTWQPDLEVGEPQIDWEHRQLLELFERLLSPDRANDSEYRRVCLDNLVAHVCTHFDHEEALMRRVGFPDFQAHREAHLSLLEQFNRFLALLDQADATVTEGELLPFVGGWLLNHIRGDDKRLGVFLRQRSGGQGADGKNGAGQAAPDLTGPNLTGPNVTGTDPVAG